MHRLNTDVRKIAVNEGGQALLLVLLLLLLTSLVVVPLLSLMGTGVRTTRVFETRTNGLYAADAGVQDGIWQLKQTTPDPNKVPATVGTSKNYSLGSLNGAAISVTIYMQDGTPTYKITATASGTNVTTTTINSYVQQAGGGWFSNAVGSLNGNITLQSGSSVNGNAAANGNISLTSGSTISNANNTAIATAAGSGATINLTSGSTIDNNTNNIVLPGGANSQNIQATKISVPTLDTSVYQNTAQNITLNNPTVYATSQTISSQTKIWPTTGTGDFDIKGSLTVQTNASLTVNGNLKVEGSLTVQSSSA